MLALLASPLSPLPRGERGASQDPPGLTLLPCQRRVSNELCRIHVISGRTPSAPSATSRGHQRGRPCPITTRRLTGLGDGLRKTSTRRTYPPAGRADRYAPPSRSSLVHCSPSSTPVE